MLNQMAQAATNSGQNSMRGSFKGLAPTRHTRRTSDNQNGRNSNEKKREYERPPSEQEQGSRPAVEMNHIQTSKTTVTSPQHIVSARRPGVGAKAPQPMKMPEQSRSVKQLQTVK